MVNLALPVLWDLPVAVVAVVTMVCRYVDSAMTLRFNRTRVLFDFFRVPKARPDPVVPQVLLV